MDQDRSRRRMGALGIHAGCTAAWRAARITIVPLLSWLAVPARGSARAGPGQTPPTSPHGGTLPDVGAALLPPSWDALAAWVWPLALLSAAALAALVVIHARLRRQVRLRVHAEILLQRQLAFKNALLGALPYPVAARDASHRYMEVNPAFEQLCGLPRDDIIGRPAGNRISGQSAEVMAEANALCRQAVASMEPASAQLEIHSAGGKARRVLYCASPFRHSDGSTGGVITTLVDITEICAAQQRAQLLERRLHDLTTTLPAIVYQIRKPHDGGAPAYTYAAGETDSSLGIAPMALMTEPGVVGRYVHPEDMAAVRAALSQPPPRPPVDMRLRVLGRHGLRWASIRSVGRIESDATIWSGVVADVTDEHRQAALLARAKDTAEAALRAKESFLAMMSHEIRTPLNGMLGMVEMLQATSLGSEQQRMLALAQESGHALAQILDDVLDYARIEAGRLAILPTPTDLRAMSDSVLGLLAPQAHNKQLHLRVHIAAEVPARIEADPIRLRQVLFNLLGNAIKFTDQGSVTLRVEAGPEQGEGVPLVISVSDTGIGISPEDQQHLFAPFVQSEHSSTRRHGGTGLGLSICKRLADLMGGELSMRSEPGEGTVVSLRLRCPVVSRHYDLPALRGHAVLLDLQDTGLAGTLRAHAEAAGLTVLEHADAGGKAATCIRLTDGPEARKSAGGGRVIYLTRTPKQLGFRVCAAGVRLSENPLRWSAFLGAVQAALETHGRRARRKGPAHARSKPGTPALRKPHTGQRVRVLVAEDHPINRELIRRQLRLLGYACTVCHDGAEALARLQRSRFQLVLTDCHMPGMNGIELARAIRHSTDAKLRALPIVGITATTLADEHARCFAEGMNQCVLKPTTLAALQAALSRALEHPDAVADSIIASGRQSLPAAHAPLSFLPARISRESLCGAPGQPSWPDAMLATCAGALRADRDALAGLLPGSQQDELRRWCHRAGGAMSVFGHPDIDEVVDRFCAVVKAGDPACIRTAGTVVLAMMDHMTGVLAPPEQPGAEGPD